MLYPAELRGHTAFLHQSAHRLKPGTSIPRPIAFSPPLAPLNQGKSLSFQNTDRRQRVAEWCRKSAPGFRYDEEPPCLGLTSLAILPRYLDPIRDLARGSAG